MYQGSRATGAVSGARKLGAGSPAGVAGACYGPPPDGGAPLPARSRAAAAAPVGVAGSAPSRAQASALRRYRIRRRPGPLARRRADARSAAPPPLPAARRRRAAPRSPLPDAGALALALAAPRLARLRGELAGAGRARPRRPARRGAHRRFPSRVPASLRKSRGAAIRALSASAGARPRHPGGVRGGPPRRGVPHELHAGTARARGTPAFPRQAPCFRSSARPSSRRM